jgi:hypothetical protein
LLATGIRSDKGTILSDLGHNKFVPMILEQERRFAQPLNKFKTGLLANEIKCFAEGVQVKHPHALQLLATTLVAKG